MGVQFFFIDARIALRERRRLKKFIQHLFASNMRSLNNLSIIFCTDEYLFKINRDFLQHEYYTDIVTFNLSEDPQVIEGEIYISLDRIKENAMTNKVTINNELHRIIFHGVLHLCGFKDKTKKDKALMTRMEDRTLNEYFG
ncbi:rRNA maturation RNase YbeY [Ferruginibacter paludis]|uniref:rRNA maturation RNase YbeY n=1 Tax=Ferruginibacter paludis TaxID=1310417 RepID=UPI0025B4EA42|nr:rRNA maturation RNase YbeY [Ferruginibacter paludis]MDN3659517.1 rRNA maturation RNase YbeY [Ferruginibacter paludis]